jgi:hypothetical protein
MLPKGLKTVKDPRQMMISVRTSSIFGLNDRNQREEKIETSMSCSKLGRNRSLEIVRQGNELLAFRPELADATGRR